MERSSPLVPSTREISSRKYERSKEQAGTLVIASLFVLSSIIFSLYILASEISFWKRMSFSEVSVVHSSSFSTWDVRPEGPLLMSMDVPRGWNPFPRS